MTVKLDRAADALLLAILERAGGDIRVAFALLCARVSPDDLTGETFEAAIGRAVAVYGGAFCRLPRGADDAPEVSPEEAP